jgi:DivIVA domain-containing protein
MPVTSRTDNRLTPDAVQAVTFPSARLGRRGLDEEHVRAFCGQVERELVRLFNERTALADEVQRLRRRVLGLSGGDAGSGFRQDDAHVQAVRILSKAQQTADRYVADAREYSRQLAQDARRRRDEILGEAKSHAALMLDEAHAEASRAAEVALSAPVSQPDAERSELEVELVYLRTFSDVYRTHLHTYLNALLRNVEEWERGEKASLATARSGLPRLPYYPLSAPVPGAAGHPEPGPGPAARAAAEPGTDPGSGYQEAPNDGPRLAAHAERAPRAEPAAGAGLAARAEPAAGAGLAAGPESAAGAGPARRPEAAAGARPAHPQAALRPGADPGPKITPPAG